jgi:glucose-6-phosphate isomerase
VKTLGHIHDPEPDSMVDYPEICEVLLGTAHFLLQKLDPGGPFARDVFYVVVKTGEKIIIPPGYDHLTINPGPGPMLFSDVIARAVSTNYTKMKKSGGGAYLEVEENGQPCFIPNPRYRQATPLRQARPLSFPELYLTPGQPLYQTFRETCGSSWPFLWEPGRFNKLFPELESLFVFD